MLIQYPPDDPREWLNRARRNLVLVQTPAEGIYLEDLCCNLQQAAEKAIKALKQAEIRENPPCFSPTAVSGIGLLSGMFHYPVLGLHRPTAGFLVVDDDRGTRFELLPYLHDFGFERDGMFAVVGTLSGHERFNDAAQGFGTEHLVGNDHRPIRLGRLHEFGRLLGLLRRLLFFRSHGRFLLAFLTTVSFFGHGFLSKEVMGVLRANDCRPKPPAPEQCRPGDA